MNKPALLGASLIVALGAAFASCESGNKTATLAYSTELNGQETVEAQYPVDEEGYTVIFDGTNLNGWRGYGRDHMPQRWSIQDSCLHFQRGEGEGGDIIFGHKFGNFEVEFDWKMSEGGNSGFFYLAQEALNPEGNLEPIYISAPEYQLLDNENHPDAGFGVDGNRKSASLYDMIPAKPQNANPWGQWNKAKVSVKDGVVTHYQNGEKVVEYQLWTPQWTELLQNSKFSEQNWPAAFALLNNCGGENHEGFIGFQDHGDEVWIKNVRVKNL
ncbi:MAG: DUF1080 domain-containing protein [Muribaculaceae bacterium]|nr:DUF1080 domain-containing protein [Muribaculaceae bacterium]